MMDDRSIAWMLAGGTRHDPPEPRRWEHLRALRESETTSRAGARTVGPATIWRQIAARLRGRPVLATTSSPLDCCGVA